MKEKIDYNYLSNSELLRDLFRKGAQWVRPQINSNELTTIDISRINIGNKNWGKIDFMRKNRGLRFNN